MIGLGCGFVIESIIINFVNYNKSIERVIMLIIKLSTGKLSKSISGHFVILSNFQYYTKFAIIYKICSIILTF